MESKQYHLAFLPMFAAEIEEFPTETDSGKSIDKKELTAGIKVEHEHLPTYEKFLSWMDKHNGEPLPKDLFYSGIAQDHLNEIETYYSWLAWMEETAKKYPYPTDYEKEHPSTAT
jgi:hypothetical protein